MSEPSQAIVSVRDLVPEDLHEVVRIDALRTGEAKQAYWRDRFGDFVGGRRRGDRVGIAVARDGRLSGYLLGEVRAFEFGSEPCGWIFAVGVDPADERSGIGSWLVETACRRFHEAGITRVRTMVERANVPVLSFFRTNGFVGGAFVQLELPLENLPSRPATGAR